MRKLRRVLIGAPKDVRDPSILHKLSLVPLLAWVGLGADGLSSSAYGPEEAFRALGPHVGLAPFLALATAITVFVISAGYSRIIEQFPAGGGGYVVATKILGRRVGVISGAALVVDYVLTITISIASGTDAVLSFLPRELHHLKLPLAFAGLVGLTLMNLRGTKESVKAISPIFAMFVVTHVIVLGAAIISHLGDVPAQVEYIRSDLSETVSTLGLAATLQLFVRAYSMGGGTYTGIEAVANATPIMREPQVETAKRTMVYMAVSLAVMAAGIVVAYLLMEVRPVEGMTMNAVLIDRVAGSWELFELPAGKAFVVLALLTEAGLLLIAAQAGFVAGPRVMANMATDSWLPHRFSALSERLTMRNGVLLLSAAAASALLYTRGAVHQLIIMYSINVFIDFTLSQVAMSVYWIRHRLLEPKWRQNLAVHLIGAALCGTILVITIVEKLFEGGWVTILTTGVFIAACFLIRWRYTLVSRAIERLDVSLPGPERGERARRIYEGLLGTPPRPEIDPTQPVAILFVGGYSGLGRHTLLTLLRMFPGHFKGVVFVTVAVVDSDTFKGVREIRALEDRTRRNLESYVRLANRLALPASSVNVIGAEIAVEAERIARELIKLYPKGLVVAGQLIFREDSFWNRVLHNETAFMIQQRLQHAGIPMIVIPVHLDLHAVNRWKRLLAFRRLRQEAEDAAKAARDVKGTPDPAAGGPSGDG